ncbi:MAG: putative succinylglutamate desuccinylase/aspartoacylase [Oscillospiraceae bacterium]|nr:putative succinylglutamate desuccinylase/aspartoacylase [Oscillospiraceae bacterium]
MLETIVSVQLPVGEHLMIQKNRFTPLTSIPACKRICVVTGIHGDELEGQYTAWKLAAILNQHQEQLRGIVDIYPALNPLGINSICRGIPLCDLDMNRIFPGHSDGPVSEFVAHQIIKDLSGADVCVDIHASNIFLRELPQVRVSQEMADTLVPLAGYLNMDFIWINASATVLESTLAHSLNSTGTPTLVVEMGVGMRITQSYGDQLLDGIFSLMAHLGIWAGEVPDVRTPIISTDGNVSFANANTSGIFLPTVSHLAQVQKGDPLGLVVNPLTGETCETVFSPASGLLFTLREYPVVYNGSLIARVLGDTP